MPDSKIKYWTVGQIDATGVRGPHEKELEDISLKNIPNFINIDMDKLKKIRELICVLFEFVKELVDPPAMPQRREMHCGKCGKPLLRMMFIPAFMPSG